MQKNLVAILAIFILTACATPPTPTPQADTPAVDAAQFIGQEVAVLNQYGSGTATLQIGDQQVEVHSHLTCYWERWFDNQGLTETFKNCHDQIEEESVSGILISVELDKWKQIVITIDNRDDFTPTQADVEVSQAWEKFTVEAGNSQNPISFSQAYLAKRDQNPAFQCDTMMDWSNKLLWLRPTIPEICIIDNTIGGTYNYGATTLSVIAQPWAQPLQCGERISDRYSVVRVTPIETAEVSYFIINNGFEIEFFDHKTGDAKTEVVPREFSFTFEIEEKYEGWADPPITWYAIANPCSTRAPQPSGSYQPQYITIQVANPRYHSAKCVAYRALGGAGSPSNPNWDPQCEYPTRTETIPVP